MPTDHYRTIAAPIEFRQKIERSEFLGFAFPVEEEQAFFDQLRAIEKRDFDATHHCWAFRLFNGGDVRARSSDAGEPSGTAGKPIASAIEGADYHDVGVIVVRWYGGVKLGTGGLTRAYRETAAEALKAAVPRDVYVYDRYTLTVPFDHVSAVYRLVASPDVLLVGETYGETNEFTFDVRRSVAERFEKELIAKRLEFRR